MEERPKLLIAKTWHLCDCIWFCCSRWSRWGGRSKDWLFYQIQKIQIPNCPAHFRPISRTESKSYSTLLFRRLLDHFWVYWPLNQSPGAVDQVGLQMEGCTSSHKTDLLSQLTGTVLVVGSMCPFHIHLDFIPAVLAISSFSDALCWDLSDGEPYN